MKLKENLTIEDLVALRDYYEKKLQDFEDYLDDNYGSLISSKIPKSESTQYRLIENKIKIIDETIESSFIDDKERKETKERN